jgi:hypothetical protein
MTLNDAWNYITTHIDTIIAVLAALGAFAQAIKQKITAGEALVLLGNALQNEKQMVNGQFTGATVQKIEQIGAATGASPAAVAAVTNTITKINQAAATSPAGDPSAPAPAATGDIKIGSLNGKPVYLGQVVGVSRQAQAVVEIFRGIFGRK